MIRLPQRKDESFPFKWGNEVQSWVLFLKLSTSVFVEAGSVRLWVSAGATGQPRWGSVWQRGSLYSTSDARTGTLSRFDPRVSWITHRSFHSCDYKAQRYTLDNVSVLSSKALTDTEKLFLEVFKTIWYFKQQNQDVYIIQIWSFLCLVCVSVACLGLYFLLSLASRNILQRTTFYFYFLVFVTMYLSSYRHSDLYDVYCIYTYKYILKYLYFIF